MSSARFVLLACGGVAVQACASSGCREVPLNTWPTDEQVDAVLPEFPARDARPVRRSFSSSFESTDDFAPFFVVPSPYMGTTFQELTTDPVVSGAHAHRAWIEGANPIVSGENTNHRGYPTVQLDKLGEPYGGVVRIELHAWVDMPLEACADKDWVSLLTLSSYADDQWYQVQLLNVDSEGTPHLMHVPVYGQSVHDIFQTHTVRVPQRQWFTVTVLLDYRDDNAWGSPMIAAWIDGELVSAARFNPRVDPASVPPEKLPDCLDGWDGQDVAQAEALCGLDFRGPVLSQAHFGLYAPPKLESGQLLNDDLEIAELEP